MKYLIVIALMLIAPALRSQSVIHKDETRLQAIEREWSQQRSLKDSMIVKIKREIQEALLEPDESIHRQGAFDTKVKVISVKQLHQELAHQYKRRDSLDNEYHDKWKALAVK